MECLKVRYKMEIQDLGHVLKYAHKCIFVLSGRAPALIDSWDQAFLTAPLFVLLEVLFFFGYRKEFHGKIMKQVEKNIKEFKAKQK